MRNTKSDITDRPAAPDFTSACVVMFGVNLVWIMIAIWAIWGFFAVLASGFIISKWIDRVQAARV